MIDEEYSTFFRVFSVCIMLYKCARCKTSKSFTNPAPTETAYCVTCQCSRLFLPNTLPNSAMYSPVRSNMPTSTSASNLVRSTTMATIRPCDYFKLCLEFMLSLDCSKRLFNRKHNRCYCENCYPPSYRDFLVEGGAKYVIPRGWVRFGLYIDDAQAEAEQIWSKWIVSYHGTSPQAAKSIIEHHQFLLPGDQCIDGNVIGIRDGHIPGKFQVYTSPTIAYSGDDIYSPSISFRSTATGKSYKAKVVLQCRQQPGTFKIQAETIRAGNRRICPIIPNSEVEYFTEVRSSIVPYGLLVCVFQ